MLDGLKSDATVSSVFFAAASQCESEWHRVLFFVCIELNFKKEKAEVVL